MPRVEIGYMLDAGWEWKPSFGIHGGHASLFLWKGAGFWLAGLEECAENYAWHDIGRAVWCASKPSPTQEYVRASKAKRRHAQG